MRIYTNSISEFGEQINLLDKTWTNIYILVDQNTKRECLPLLLESSPFLEIANLLVLDAGEEYKSLEICESLWSSLASTGADRKSLLINLGGGVITDMGGFVASTFKRGIDFIHIPTTLLGQVDAAIGGKTGVNLEYSKNQIGTYALPLFTFIDIEFLRTLSEREFTSGMGEVVKYGLIADRALFELLKDKENLLTNLNFIVSTCIALKKEIVTQDFEEVGGRKKLNFGHTIGHAIESYFMGEVLHGEAIAAGMISESFIAQQLDLITEDELKEIILLVDSLFDRIEIEQKMLEPILSEMKADKKNENGRFNFTLLNGIGSASIDHFIEEKLIIKSLNFYFK